ncbi:MAG: tetratricopeptide repeat protein [Chloroflexota bacterium]
MQLTLSFLGPFQAIIDDNPMPESRAKKIEALLIYLAMEAQIAHRRETLVGLLFPDLPDESARTNLRQTLTRLRKAIGDNQANPPFLLTSRETTQFNSASRTIFDVRQFNALLQGFETPAHKDSITRLESAISLYRGPFLDGFFLEDSIEFEDWILVYRERFQQLAISAAQTVTDYYEKRGDFKSAQRYAERLLEIEPWDEGAQRQYLRLLAYQGKRNVALKKYEQFSKRLFEELGVEPSFESEQLRQQIILMAEKRPSNLLPRHHTLYGREDDLAAIFEQLINPETRLITLVGHGGIGKTRLATEVGWHTIETNFGQFMHGTFFVPLAGISGKDAKTAVDSAILTAVAESLGFSFDNTSPFEQQLISFLKDRSLLLILDNLEHIINDVRQFINSIIQHTTQIKIITTSRERLKLMMEWVHPIQGLPYPLTPDDVETIKNYGAIQLFIERAKQNDSTFTLKDNPACTIENVIEICQRLHGMPLAIELAAPLTTLMTGREILQEIQTNQDALSSTMHHLPDRHQSIRAVFESSWHLLKPAEQKAIVNLSIFQGGFDRMAAQQIAGASIQIISSLIDKSLLTRTMTHAKQGRFQIQELLRQFCDLKRRELNESSQNATLLQSATPTDDIAIAHSQYFLTLLAQQYKRLISETQIEALSLISQEIENIRLAWEIGINRRLLPLLEQALDPLTLFFYMKSRLSEGASLFKGSIKNMMLGSNTVPMMAKTVALIQARKGWLEFLLGQQNEGVKQLQASIDALKAPEDSDIDLYSISYLAAAYQIMGDLDDAKKMAKQGLKKSEGVQNSYYQAINNNILSQTAYAEGNFEKAREHGESSLALERALGNQWSMGFSLVNLGRASFSAGDYDSAQTQYQESLLIRQKLDDIRGQAICLNYLGDAFQASGDLDKAEENYKSSISFFQKINSQTGIASSFTRLGHVTHQQGKQSTAKHYFQTALKYASEADSKPNLIGALFGLATIEIENGAADLYDLTEMILYHPASTLATKQKAAAVIDTLKQKGASSKQPISLEEGIERFS